MEGFLRSLDRESPRRGESDLLKTLVITHIKTEKKSQYAWKEQMHLTVLKRQII